MKVVSVVRLLYMKLLLFANTK